MKLLLVEDDQHLGKLIKQDLTNAGFIVDLAVAEKSSECIGTSDDYDMILLDAGLPNSSGLDILKIWQKKGLFTPVLVFSAQNNGENRADFKTDDNDYLGNTFHIEELLARLNVIIKRSKEDTPIYIDAFGLYLDENNKTVTNDNVVHDLTPIEYMLLRLFLLNPNQLFTKSKLIESLYELDFDPSSNVLEVYISRLRQKIGKQRIVTRRNQGYLFKNGV